MIDKDKVIDAMKRFSQKPVQGGMKRQMKKALKILLIIALLTVAIAFFNNDYLKQRARQGDWAHKMWMVRQFCKNF